MYTRFTPSETTTQPELAPTTIDADGVALAAIQGLHAQNQELMAENRAQQARIDALARQNAEFEARLSALEADQGAAGGPLGANPLLWTGGLLLAVAGVWSFRRDWSAKTGGEGAR